MQASSNPPVLSRRSGEARDLWQLGVLPVMALGALAGLLGIYWDIAWHVDKGRDTFFTPPHNFIYSALGIVLLTSAYALARDRRDTGFHLRLGRLRLHPGALIVALGAALELFFAPADELWHRFFGTDATLWGPMHLIGVTGLTLASLGGLVSAWLEREVAPTKARRRFFGDLALFFAAALMGWAVLLLAEYEFGIQQFPMLFHPVLLAGLPTFALVLVARLSPRPWSATLAALGFEVIRLAIEGSLRLSAEFDLAGQTRPMIPLLVFSGVAVDLLASRRLNKRPAPGWLAGLAAGAVTLAANLAVVSLGDRTPWTPDLLLRAVPLGLALAALAGALGAAVGGALEPRGAESAEGEGARA